MLEPDGIVVQKALNNGFSYTDGISYKGPGTREYQYLRKREVVKDNDKLKWRVGDIISFRSMYNEFEFGDWKDWYLKEEDKERFYSRNKSVPIYAHKKLGLILQRYRIVKIKSRYNTYRDYGSTILMLNGTKKGHIRNYYMNTPYIMFSKFPHYDLFNINLSKKILPTDDHILKDIFDIISFEETRNKFIKKVKTLLKE